MVGRRIERVVDRNARGGAERAIGVDHGLAAAVGQDQVIARYQSAEGIARVGGDALQRRRRVHVPEDHQAAWCPQAHHLGLEQLVEHADTARLDDHIGAGGIGQSVERGFGAGRIDHDARPFGIVDVAMRWRSKASGS